MKIAPDRNGIEGGAALAADLHDTRDGRRACTSCSLPEIVVQLERLVAATLRQTAMMKDCSHQISAAIILGQDDVHFVRTAAETAEYISEEVAECKRRTRS